MSMVNKGPGELPEAMEIADDLLEAVTGGTASELNANPNDVYHYSGNFAAKTVCSLPKSGPGSELTLQMSPNGVYVAGHTWRNNDTIQVNTSPFTRSGRWVFVYSSRDGGAFGYVDSAYLR